MHRRRCGLAFEEMEGSAQALKIEISAERRNEFPGIFSKIKLRYVASGVKEEDLRKAIEESMQKFCSVSAMLGSVTEIEYEY